MFDEEHIVLFRRASEKTGIRPVEGNCELKEHGLAVLMQMSDGEIVCPMCRNKEIERKKVIEVEEINKIKRKERSESRQRSFLENRSIVNNKTFMDKGFKNYVVKDEKEKRVRDLMLGGTNRMVEGEVFKIFLQGPTGVGKSHLAAAGLLNYNMKKNGVKCLFVNFNRVLSVIRATYSNFYTGKHDRNYYVDMMIDVDLLVIDDLGSEVGDINTKNKATDHNHQILYEVLEGRVDKSTIITSNIPQSKIKELYDSKIDSRLSENLEVISFDGLTDKRIEGV